MQSEGGGCGRGGGGCGWAGYETRDPSMVCPALHECALLPIPPCTGLPGLQYHDLIVETPVSTLAISRLPEDLKVARERRLKRALDLSFKASPVPSPVCPCTAAAQSECPCCVALPSPFPRLAPPHFCFPPVALRGVWADGGLVCFVLLPCTLYPPPFPAPFPAPAPPRPTPVSLPTLLRNVFCL